MRARLVTFLWWRRVQPALLGSVLVALGCLALAGVAGSPAAGVAARMAVGVAAVAYLASIPLASRAGSRLAGALADARAVPLAGELMAFVPVRGLRAIERAALWFYGVLFAMAPVAMLVAMVSRGELARLVLFAIGAFSWLGTLGLIAGGAMQYRRQVDEFRERFVASFGPLAEHTLAKIDAGTTPDVPRLSPGDEDLRR